MWPFGNLATARELNEARAEMSQLSLENERLEESIQSFAAEDRGWQRLASDAAQEFTREQAKANAAICRASAVVNPLIGRGINLRIAYVWGQGVNIAARQEDQGGQDINAVIQRFLDDPSNKASFTSSQAREELERALGTDGNIYLALFTDPLTGRVQVRSVPDAEIDDVITNPEDRDDPWFYQRTYAATTIVQTQMTTSTRTTTKTVLYPAVGYWPKMRPRSIDGKEVRWGEPVIHACVNRLDGWKFGVPDAYPAVAWARGYKEFLEDWARLMKALSRFAFRASTRGKNATQVRSRLSPKDDGGPSQIGATVLTGPDQSFEAIPKSGATIDSESGRPLAAMVASAFDVPITMLLCDPGVTGARATAETLDQPMEYIMGMRRELWASVIHRVLDYVIDQAVKAPQGMLKGTRTVDQFTGREMVRLAGDQDRTVDITFPSISKTPVETIINAIVNADKTGKLPPLFTARVLMEELGAKDIDDLLDQITDADGNFVDPWDASQARAQQQAVADGNLPAVSR